MNLIEILNHFLVSTLLQRIQEWLRKVTDFIRTFNLFKSVPSSINEYDLRNEIISTRIFIILLTLSLTTLLMYNSLINITDTKKIEELTLKKYSQLYLKYSDILTCRCTTISINYDKIFRIDYTLHQLCNSMFISTDWLDYVGRYGSQPQNIFDDFRAIALTQFQALNVFCQTVNRTISNSLIQFYSTQYVSKIVTPSHIFALQTQALIDQFKALTKTNLFLLLDLIRSTTQANALYSGQETNYELEKLPNHGNMNIYPRWYNNCSCDYSMKCVYETPIYRYGNQPMKLFSIPGLLTGCYIIEAILQSTIECFYNKTCITQIQSGFQDIPILNITPLDSSLTTRYFVNSTIQELLDHLMIEQWNISSTYENYYNQCQPIQCTYTYKRKNTAIYIATALLGLVGGLVIVLRWIVLILVKFVGRIRQRRRQERELEGDVNRRKISVFAKSKTYLKTLNVFPSVPHSINQYDLQNEIISTRIFIILLIFSFTILLVYNSLLNITNTIYTEKPTFEEYKRIYRMYPETLTCPCTTIATNYKEFLQINYTLHQLCTSMFVTEEWFKYLSYRFRNNDIHPNDFRWIGQALFQALDAFCQMANRTISNSLIQFYSTQYVSETVTASHVFTLQTETSLNQSIDLAKTNFFLALDVIQNTTRANLLISARKTNYHFYYASGRFGSTSDAPNITCSFGNLHSDNRPVSLGNHLNETATFYIPGLLTGCFVIEAILQSTLECFYNETCITQIQSYFEDIPTINVKPLDSSLTTRYFVNSTIQELLDHLMIEQWNISSKYENYYNQCQPIQCTYTYETKNTAIYMTTLLIGLVGGFVTILRWIVPMLVKFIRKRIRRQQQQKQEIPISETRKRNNYM